MVRIRSQYPGGALTANATPTTPTNAIRFTIDTFFSIPIRAESGAVKVGSTELCAGEKTIRTTAVTDGPVG